MRRNQVLWRKNRFLCEESRFYGGKSGFYEKKAGFVEENQVSMRRNQVSRLLGSGIWQGIRGRRVWNPAFGYGIRYFQGNSGREGMESGIWVWNSAFRREFRVGGYGIPHLDMEFGILKGIQGRQNPVAPLLGFLRHDENQQQLRNSLALMRGVEHQHHLQLRNQVLLHYTAKLHKPNIQLTIARCGSASTPLFARITPGIDFEVDWAPTFNAERGSDSPYTSLRVPRCSSSCLDLAKRIITVRLSAIIGMTWTPLAIQAVGMAINTELCLLICIECRAAFTAENYSGHLQRAHKEIKIPKGLKNLVHAQHISDVYPDLARGLLTQALNKGIIIARNPSRVIAPNVNSVQRLEEVMEQSKMLSEMYAMTKGLVATVHNLQTNIDRIESILTNIDPPLRADKGKGDAVESPLMEPNYGVFSDDEDHSALFDKTLAPYLENNAMHQASILKIIQSDQTQAMPSGDTSAHFIDISSDDEDVKPIVPALSSKRLTFVPKQKPKDGAPAAKSMPQSANSEVIFLKPFCRTKENTQHQLPPLQKASLLFRNRKAFQPMHRKSAQDGVKRNLEEAFGVLTEKARKCSRNLPRGRYKELDVCLDLFKQVGNACGYCVVLGTPDPGAHSPFDCPAMSPEQRQDLYDTFRRMQYPDDIKGPCYKCHIVSYGNDALHRPFRVKGQNTCDHPNLVMGLAYGILSFKELRDRAEQYFAARTQWSSLLGFKRWFLTQHMTLQWNSMALLKWYSEYLINME
ncbi:hypothetical protein K438DRAFT_2100571 [Mycena galopus ATCC 62051]|nr:hypothetical protein K438DRAFT_2100571 [Mycena galopus ATCC 62051]